MDTQNAPQPAEGPIEDPRKKKLEARYQEELEQREALEEAREYALFKLEKEFGIGSDTIELWKKNSPLGVDLTWVNAKPYIYQVVQLSEFMAAGENALDFNEIRKRVVFKALLAPKFKKESDLLLAPAGLIQTLSDAIFRSSGFIDNAVSISL